MCSHLVDFLPHQRTKERSGFQARCVTLGAVRRRRIWVVGILTLAASAALPPLSATATTPSAATLYGQALATTHAWSVHYASTGTFHGTTILTSGDAGPASGIQTALVHKAGFTDSATFIVIGDLTYMKGNAHALVDLAGLSPAQALAAVDKWVLFSTANQNFTQAVAGVRSLDVAQELALTGPFTLGRTRTIDGTRVEAIRGRQRLGGSKLVPAVLYVRASGTHVPVEEDSLNAKGQPNGVEHTVYSKWGEPVRPAAPSSAIPIGPVGTT
jgi:hypothetical protein